MENDILFKSQKEKEATERVLATIRIKNINEEMDKLISEMMSYATLIDDILEKNGLKKRYLIKVADIENELLDADEEINNIEYRDKEVVLDYIKRINTRINIIKANNTLLDEIESTYDLSKSDFDKDIEESKIKID